jgi:hypothetical protein
MQLPTQDIEAKTAVMDILWRFDPGYKKYGTTVIQTDAQDILRALEKLGYHKGLPSSIEEALNSGDGV